MRVLVVVGLAGLSLGSCRSSTSPSADARSSDASPSTDRAIVRDRALDAPPLDRGAKADGSRADGPVIVGDATAPADGPVTPTRVHYVQSATHLSGLLGSEQAVVLAARPAGGFYLGGAYNNSFTVGVASLSTQPRNGATELGAVEGFVGRFDSGGNALWLERIGGTPATARVTSVAATGSGLVAVGWFRDSVAFDASVQATATKGRDGFVARYKDAGGIDCLTTLAGLDEEEASAVSSGAGLTFVAGRFGSSMKIGTTLVSGPNASNAFVAAFDAQCALTWFATLSATTVGPLVLLPNGRLVLHATVSGTLSVTDGSGYGATLASTGAQSVLLGVEAPSGRLSTGVDCLKCQGPADCPDPGATCSAAKLCDSAAAVDRGCFVNACQSCATTACPTGASCHPTTKLCMLDSNPALCAHPRQLAPPLARFSAAGPWAVSQLATDTSSNLYVVGTFSGPRTFLAGDTALLNAGSSSDAFVFSVDPALQTRFVVGIGATGGVSATGTGVALGQNVVYVATTVVGGPIDNWQHLGPAGLLTPIGGSKVLPSRGPGLSVLFAALSASDGKTLLWTEHAAGTLDATSFMGGQLATDGVRVYQTARFLAGSLPSPFGPGQLPATSAGTGSYRFYTTALKP